MKKIIILLALLLFVLSCSTDIKTGDQYCNNMRLSQAYNLAENNDCIVEGLTDQYICNENTKTWWINLETEKEGCSPACVINTETEDVEINWRCTGLVVE